MTERPLLRFPEPTLSNRRTGAPRTPPQPTGPGRNIQVTRFQRTFNRLSTALESYNPEVVLRSDPAGIAPERALVFVTAGSVQNFARIARDIGLEVFSETELEETDVFPDGFTPPGEARELPRTLYATMPTLEIFQRLLTLWNAYQRGESAPRGAAPWWRTFELLLEIRPWGPGDRLTDSAREIIENRLPLEDDEEVPIEIEIWPTSRAEQRAVWREQTEQRITELDGRIVDRSSIAESGFIYEAMLATLPAHAVKTMLDNPDSVGGLATLEGIHLILPQTIGQASPGDIDGETGIYEALEGFDLDAPQRGALFDGTPAAGHAALDGGVVIEDIHDLVGRSIVNMRDHATAMASLILRGDLVNDGSPVRDTRLVSVPVLIDSEGGAWTPEDRLFVDLIHTTLTRLLLGEEPLAPDVFVVNFSIGISDNRFAGRISSLARLMDWWAEKFGVLFVVSAGNIGEPLQIPGMSAVVFEDSDDAQQREIVRNVIKQTAHSRTLLAPAEALNGLAVGAISMDLSGEVPPDQAGIITVEDGGEIMPQITSALGLGLHRSIKPDILQVGGKQELRIFPNGTDTSLSSVRLSQRTGLVAASPRGGEHATQKSRGTSPAAALTTRAVLQAAEALTGEGGPYEGLELPRKTLSLLGRTLAVNAARWTGETQDAYEKELQLLGRGQHARAKEEVCRYFGYGALVPDLMTSSPEGGVTMVGLGTIRKDQAQVFKLPLPPSMSGERVPRSMRITISWFSPTNPARAQYRLASLEAIAADGVDEQELDGWGLNLKPDGPDANMIKRGTVWSRRMTYRTQKVPEFGDDAVIPVCIQCRDASSGGLSPDEDIEFAIAVTLEVEAEVQYDIHNEIEQKIRLQLQGGA